MNRTQAFRTFHVLRAVAITSVLVAGLPPAAAQNRPPWPAGDEIGMANTLGPATWQRCAPHLANPNAKSYELSHLRSNTMPQSPFAVPLRENAKPTVGIQGTRHAFNADEVVSGDPGQQGTQMDALGHFAVLPQPWDGKGEFLSGGATYYGGYKQGDVKPTPDSPLKKLGIDKVPPIITTAVLLDAKAHLGRGNAMQPGQLVTAADIEAMLKAQGLKSRGLVAGDVLYIYTGWGDHWKDPDTEKFYYTKGPGLAYDAAQLIEQKSGRAGGARQSVHRSGGRGLPRGQGAAAGGDACRPAVRDPSPQSDGGGHSQHPERQSRRARARQGLALLHDHPAAAHAGCLRLAGAAGRDRRADALTAFAPDGRGRPAAMRECVGLEPAHLMIAPRPTAIS